MAKQTKNKFKSEKPGTRYGHFHNSKRITPLAVAKHVVAETIEVVVATA
jgi:hypothetical protein